MPIDLYDVIHRRRDVRGQFTGAPIPDQTLDRVLAAAHAAPSVGLSQPWDFIVVRDRAIREAFHRHVHHERDVFAATLDADAAARFARIKIDGVLESTLSVVVTYDPWRGGPAVLGRHAIADAGLYSVCLAIGNLWLSATAALMALVEPGSHIGAAAAWRLASEEFPGRCRIRRYGGRLTGRGTSKDGG